MELRGRLFHLKMESMLFARRNVNALRGSAEMMLGMKPLSPPVPKVAKARSIKKALLISSSPKSGYSHPYNAFFRSVGELAEAEHFDYIDVFRRAGKKEMNRMLLRHIERQSPDLAFFYLYTNEFEPQTILCISTDTPSITLNCFADDEWRFDSYSRHWAPLFNRITTTDPRSLRRYSALGYPDAMLCHWSADPSLFKKAGGREKYGVSFVGSAYHDRQEIMRSLAKKNIDVSCFGDGWSAGPAGFDKMARIFGSSRININLSRSMYGNVLMEKARIYEVTACGGFLLCEYFPGLEDCYEIGKEIAVFHDRRELPERIAYYLSHEEERKNIADAGYERTRKDHTSLKRIEQIFRFVTR